MLNNWKKTYILITVALTVITFIGNSHAANWYVDSSASGSKDGTSWENAWTSFANIASTNIGDTIYISGGLTNKTYNQQLTIPAGRIIRPGAAHTSPLPSHSGVVIINSPTAYGVQVYGNNVTIDGLANGTRKIKITGGDRGVNVENGFTGALVRGLEITKNWVGIRFYMGYGEVDNCYIHDLSSTSDAGIQGLYTTHSTDYGRLVVHDSVIEVMRSSDGIGADGIQTTNGLIAYNNSIYSVLNPAYSASQHQDAIQQTGYVYTKIYNNKFFGFRHQTLYMENSSHHIKIENNYFEDCKMAIVFGGVNSEAHDDINISNNTIVNGLAGAPAIYLNSNPSRVWSTTTIKSNAIVNSSDAGIVVQPGIYTCGIGVVIDLNVTTGVMCNGKSYAQSTSGGIFNPKFPVILGIQ